MKSLTVISSPIRFFATLGMSAMMCLPLSGCLNQMPIDDPDKKPIQTETTDWTPFLKSMMDGCNYPYMLEGYPDRFKKSVINVEEKLEAKGDMGEDIYTYNLRNATAFGYPLDKIKYYEGYEWSDLRLVFKDTGFMALRPYFELPKDKYGDQTVSKNDGSGYDTTTGMYIYLDFDKNKKSITCGSGV